MAIDRRHEENGLETSGRKTFAEGRWSTLSALLLSVSLSTGCASTGRYSLAAVQLKSAAQASGANDLEKVHDLVQDSQTKCATFVASMFATTANSNTILDVIGTIFSALAGC
jgi:hypothetical protein